MIQILFLILNKGRETLPINEDVMCGKLYVWSSNPTVQLQTVFDNCYGK